MTQLVSEGAALAHRMTRSRDPDEHGTTLRVAHRHAVFVRAGVEHRHVDAGGLLDERDQVTQRLQAQPVCLAEASGSGASVRLGIHAGTTVRPWPGWPVRPGSR
jgi:hypothetical protein